MATMGTELLRATARASFWQAYNSFPDPFAGLYASFDSNADQETYPQLTAPPSPREMAGGRQKKSLAEISYTIKNKKWESSVPISYELYRHGKADVVASMMGQLGAKARAYPSYLMTTLLVNGATGLGYDGQYFFDSDHVDPGALYSTNQDNDLTANIDTPAAPGDANWATAIKAAYTSLLGFKDGAGDPVWGGPNPKFVVMVGPTHLTQARRTEVVAALASGEGNDLQGTYTTVLNPWITGTDTIYVFNPAIVQKPFILQTADPVTLEDDMDGDNWFNNKEITFGSFAYYNAGYGDWRGVVRYVFT